MHKVIIMKCKTGYLFRQMQQEKIQHEDLSVMINITFLTLCVIREVFI